MKAFCVIPARRGSKRLSDKNLRALCGRPMLEYTVAAAIDSAVFELVVVSTEDEEIAAVARGAGAVAHRRPDSLAGDLVSATDVCIEAFESYGQRLQSCDAIVCLQPSSPLRDARDVREAWRHFETSGADFLVSVTPVDPHYFHWAVVKDGDWWRMWFGRKFLKERPLLPSVHRPNGAVKIGLIEPLTRLRHFFGPRLTVYEMDESRSVHVATRYDLAVADALMAERLARR